MGFVVNYPPATNVTVNDDGTQIVVAAAGPTGPQGDPGVVAATAPVTYDSGTQTVGLDQAAVTIGAEQVSNNVAYKRMMTNPSVGEWLVQSGLGIGVTLTDNRVYLVPLAVPRAMSVDRISCRVWSAGAASTVIRLGAYEMNDEGEVGGLLFDAGSVEGDTAGTKEITIDETLPAGLIYVAIVAQGGTPQVSRQDDLARLIGISQTTNPTNNGLGTHIVQNNVTGALPASLSTFSLTGNVPLIALRRSA